MSTLFKIYDELSCEFYNLHPDLLPEYNGDDDTDGIPDIKRVIFNDPATIVYWADRSKTVVKADRETFDKEKGLAMAIIKKLCGNKGNYYNVFHKWIGDCKQ